MGALTANIGFLRARAMLHDRTAFTTQGLSFHPATWRRSRWGFQCPYRRMVGKNPRRVAAVNNFVPPFFAKRHRAGYLVRSSSGPVA